MIQSARKDVFDSTVQSTTHQKLKSLYPRYESAHPASVQDIVASSLRKEEFGIPGYHIGAVSHKMLIKP